MTSPNKQTFNLSLLKEKAFDLIIAGTAAVDTFIFNIRQKTTITFLSTAIFKVALPIKSKVRVIISQVKLTVKPIQSINARKMTISVIFRQIGKLAVSLTSTNTITFVTKATQKLVSGIIVSHPILTLNPIVASFLPLSTHDVKDLSVMDVEDLVDLDYII